MTDKDLEDLVSNSIHSSLGSLFQQLVTDKSFHSSSSSSNKQSDATIGDFGGSDFKRLALKSRQRQAAEGQGYHARRWSSTSTSSSSSSASFSGYEDDDEDDTLSNSPSMDDMQPRRPFMLGQPQHIILPRPAQDKQKKRPGFMNKLYDVFFTHEDFYFNNDRNELSKDMFPTEHRHNW
ncbi:hypothetical protein BCR43DRAFT_496179 [Syncephalastrum racemosum]|uniref:Uncharacterized protein n=1 Tax=Syncephalastrum racemosum TaxID=13706 RepID=A0A1X2H3M1_SYNRA|nr:hypothetical protein BCR43DRAFT_496179 [Syncephalastrum racemosum]